MWGWAEMMQEAMMDLGSERSARRLRRKRNDPTEDNPATGEGRARNTDGKRGIDKADG